jgi:MFS family permease
VVLSFAVLRLTGSPSRLGLALACQSAAALLLTLAGGVAGDRFARGRLLTGSLAVRAASAAVLAVILLTGTASFPLLIMAAAYGCADGFFGPTSTALLPDVVPRAQLTPANALLGGSTSTAAIASPAIAGIIVAALGPGAGFSVQAAVLAIAAGSIVATRLPASRPAPAGRTRLASSRLVGSNSPGAGGSGCSPGNRPCSPW